MLTNPILNEQLIALRSQVDEVVKDLHQLTSQIGHDELANTVSELRNRLHDPFMFVIVGEVKAGKSSFINALLNTGKDICAVSPAPMTDTIQQITWGEKESFVVVNPYLKKVLIPEPVLKDIAIVDTPGTNTIVAHHQEITERFIPASDLIVFVFESKNPYRQSAWDFFDFIHADWRKKIIFVLQQKDLMTAEDLQININGVYNYAQKKGVNHPQIFCVSAKSEQEGHHEASGFAEVRDFIRDNITGGKAPLLKLENNVETALNINDRIANGLQLRKQQWEQDTVFREDIRQTLDNQERKSNNHVDILVENLVAAYDRNTHKTSVELEEGLSFVSLIKRSFSSIFNQNASARVWLENLTKELDTNLNNELRNKLNDGVIDLVDSIQQMARMIDLKIKTNSILVNPAHEDIFSDISDRRNVVLKDLQDTFSRFMSRSESFSDDNLFSGTRNIAPNLATGGGLAVIGVILTTVTKATVLDVTGGILTAVGLLFAGVTVGIQRRKVINGYEAEVAKGRLQLIDELNMKLKTYVRTIKKRIEDNFRDFDSLLANEETQIRNLSERHGALQTRLTGMQQAVKKITV